MANLQNFIKVAEFIALQQLKSDLTEKLDSDYGLDELAHNSAANELLNISISLNEIEKTLYELYRVDSTSDKYEVLETNEPAVFVGSIKNPKLTELEDKTGLDKIALKMRLKDVEYFSTQSDEYKKVMELYNSITKNNSSSSTVEEENNFAEINQQIIINIMRQIDARIKEIKAELWRISKAWNNLSGEGKKKAAETKQLKLDLEAHMDRLAKLLANPPAKELHFDLVKPRCSLMRPSFNNVETRADHFIFNCLQEQLRIAA